MFKSLKRFNLLDHNIRSQDLTISMQSLRRSKKLHQSLSDAKSKKNIKTKALSTIIRLYSTPTVAKESKKRGYE